MKVIWLRKQYQAYLEYVSTAPKREAVWIIHSRVAELKRYLRGNYKAIAALDAIDQIAAKISKAINEGDYEMVKKLAEEASKQRSVVAEAMAEAQNITDEARQYFLEMSDAIRALGGY
jgi:chemotaxis regulatin CheY-phosphate phosphatase CheZ